MDPVPDYVQPVMASTDARRQCQQRGLCPPQATAALVYYSNDIDNTPQPSYHHVLTWSFEWTQACNYFGSIQPPGRGGKTPGDCYWIAVFNATTGQYLGMLVVPVAQGFPIR